MKESEWNKIDRTLKKARDVVEKALDLLHFIDYQPTKPRKCVVKKKAKRVTKKG